jgi:hypothetical protein
MDLPFPPLNLCDREGPLCEFTFCQLVLVRLMNTVVRPTAWCKAYNTMVYASNYILHRYPDVTSVLICKLLCLLFYSSLAKKYKALAVWILFSYLMHSPKNPLLFDRSVQEVKVLGRPKTSTFTIFRHVPGVPTQPNPPSLKFLDSLLLKTLVVSLLS